MNLQTNNIYNGDCPVGFDMLCLHMPLFHLEVAHNNPLVELSCSSSNLFSCELRCLRIRIYIFAQEKLNEMLNVWKARPTTFHVEYIYIPSL